MVNVEDISDFVNSQYRKHKSPISCINIHNYFHLNYGEHQNAIRNAIANAVKDKIIIQDRHFNFLPNNVMGNEERMEKTPSQIPDFERRVKNLATMNPNLKPKDLWKLWEDITGIHINPETFTRKIREMASSGKLVRNNENRYVSRSRIIKQNTLMKYQFG